MSIQIYYDLETSDLNRIGQILNYAFLVVDSNYELVDECCGSIRIDRLQLPRARALLANRINPIEHQREITTTEDNALCQIDAFLRKYERGSTPVHFIGYNSSQFDLPYLRTSLGRNGIYPYHRFQHHDLLHLARKLLVSNGVFRKTLFDHAKATEQKVNLRLENLTQLFGILEGVQLHESRDDVLLTIKLAKYLEKEFGIAIRKFDPYEALSLHKLPRGTVVTAGEYLDEEGALKVSRRSLLCSDYKASLWVDLDRYQKAKEEGTNLSSCIDYFRSQQKMFFTDGEPLSDPHYLELARESLKDFGDLNLNNFFGETHCDIEEWIYRINPARFSELRPIFTGEVVNNSLSEDEAALKLRYRLKNFQPGGKGGSAMKEAMKEYALYRYGGKLLLSLGEPSVLAEEGRRVRYHPNYNDLLAECQTALLESHENGNGDDEQILSGLLEFYQQSEISEVAGEELLAIPAVDDSVSNS